MRRCTLCHKRNAKFKKNRARCRCSSYKLALDAEIKAYRESMEKQVFGEPVILSGLSSLVKGDTVTYTIKQTFK